MTIGKLEDIVASLPPGARLLGLDLGAKTIGLAVSDSAHMIASPLKTIQRTKFSRDIGELAGVVRDYQIGGYVFGWPLNMDGTPGPRCDATRSFADELAKNPQVVGENPWIGLWDERLSTASVDDFLVETVDMSRTKRKQVIDKLAAQHILQGALDFIRSASAAGR
jgi:putative Holliday junction resolvase